MHANTGGQEDSRQRCAWVHGIPASGAKWDTA